MLDVKAAEPRSMLVELRAGVWGSPRVTELPRQLPNDGVGPNREAVLQRAASVVLAFLLRCWAETKALCAAVLIFLRWRALGIRTIPPQRLHERTAGYLQEGSCGKVVIGRLHGEKVAIKTLFARPGMSRTDLLRSFLNEVEMMNGHSHSNVIGCKGVCLAGNSLRMVMEYCPEGSLYTLLRSDGYQNKPWAFKVKLAFGIAKGMLFLHSQKRPIVHCDLKSPNIVLKADHTPVITDFGMASLVRAKNNEDQNATWLAPEVACRGEEATTKSDVYSFGIIMWEILTGDRPWGGAHPWAIRNALEDMQRPEVSHEVLENCKGYIGADDYIALMKNCWQEAPEKRPDFEHVMDQLQSILCMIVGPLTFGEYIPLSHQDPAMRPQGKVGMQWNRLLIEWLARRGWD